MEGVFTVMDHPSLVCLCCVLVAIMSAPVNNSRICSLGPCGQVRFWPSLHISVGVTCFNDFSKPALKDLKWCICSVLLYFYPAKVFKKLHYKLLLLCPNYFHLFLSSFHLYLNTWTFYMVKVIMDIQFFQLHITWLPCLHFLKLHIYQFMNYL